MPRSSYKLFKKMDGDFFGGSTFSVSKNLNSLAQISKFF